MALHSKIAQSNNKHQQTIDVSDEFSVLISLKINRIYNEFISNKKYQLKQYHLAKTELTYNQKSSLIWLKTREIVINGALS